MRKIVISVCVLIVVVVGAALIFGSSYLNHYRPQIQGQVEKQLGRPVTLGRLSLHLLPLSLKVDGLTIEEDPAFRTSKPFATASQVFISAGFFSLLTGNPEIKSLVLDQPNVEIIRNSNGLWNFNTLGRRENKSSGSSLTLDMFKIADGQIAYTDQAVGQVRSVYDHIDVDVEHFSADRKFQLKLAAHLPGKGQQLLNFDGNVGPLQNQNSSATPFSGHVTAQELSLSQLDRFSPNTVPADTDAVLTGEADVSTSNQMIVCKGNLKFVDSMLHGSKLAFPIATHYDFSANRVSNVIQVQSASIGVGQTSFNINGTINASAKPTTLNLHVATSNSSIAELGQLAGALAGVSNPSYHMKGVISADVTATGAVTTPILNGSINATNVEVSGGDIKTPLLIASIQLALTPQALQSSTFAAQSGSTTLHSQFALANYSTANKIIDATFQTAGANMAELLNIAKAYGVSASQDMSGTGTLSLNLRVQGPLSNTSALTFAGSGDIHNANITTLRLTKHVEIKTATLAFSQNMVAASNVSASIGTTTVQGSFSVHNFAAPMVQFALTADKIDTFELEHLTNAADSPATSQKNSGSWMNSISGKGTLAANTIKMQELTLTNMRTSCTFDHGIVHLSPESVDLFGGKEAGTITLDTKPVNMLVSVNAKLSGLDSNALLSTLSSVKNTLYGSLAADANLDFSSASSSSDISKSLNGTLSFAVTNGHLHNISILNEVAKAGRFLGRTSSSNSTDTELKHLSGLLTLRGGVASTSNLAAALDVGSLSANGTLNLVDQGLDMHVDTVLAQSTSQSVGGSGIGGYLSSALANNKGELVFPMIVTGSTSHPMFTPDVQALAKMKLSNLLPTTGDPSKLTSGIIGALESKKGAGGILNSLLGGSPSQPKQAPNKKEDDSQNSINSILQQFGKKKPKQ